MATFAVFVVLVILGYLLKGATLSILWGWFVVPVFGAPALTIAPAIGIALIVSYLTFQDSGNGNSTLKIDWSRAIAKLIILPFVVLFIGLVVKGFM